MILSRAYYIIKPTSALKKRLTSLVDSDLAELLSEIVFGTYHRAELFYCDTDRVKLLFLADIMSEYFSGDMFSKLFGTSKIGLQVFDNWWTIERYFIEKDFEEIEKRIQPSVAKLFLNTGKPGVDFWIDEMQSKS